MDKITISVFTDIENPFSMTQCDQPDDHQCNLVIYLFASNLYNSYLPHRDISQYKQSGGSRMGNSSSVKYNISPEELKAIRKVLLLTGQVWAGYRPMRAQ